MSGNRLIRPAVTPRAPGSLILVALAAAAGCGGHTISGEVTGGGVVEVVLSGRASARTTTDASGRYAFASLADGDYAVTPRKTSWSFVPPSVAVTVKSANAVAKRRRDARRISGMQRGNADLRHFNCATAATRTPETPA